MSILMTSTPAALYPLNMLNDIQISTEECINVQKIQEAFPNETSKYCIKQLCSAANLNKMFFVLVTHLQHLHCSNILF